MKMTQTGSSQDDVVKMKMTQTGSSQDGVKMFCGESVKPGVGPGVLIGETKVWRNGKEMITDVERIFPSGSTISMCPDTTSSPMSITSRLWTTTSSLTMLVVGLGAKFLLRTV